MADLTTPSIDLPKRGVNLARQGIESHGGQGEFNVLGLSRVLTSRIEYENGWEEEEKERREDVGRSRD